MKGYVGAEKILEIQHWVFIFCVKPHNLSNIDEKNTAKKVERQVIVILLFGCLLSFEIDRTFSTLSCLDVRCFD